MVYFQEKELLQVQLNQITIFNENKDKNDNPEAILRERPSVLPKYF